MKLFQHIFKIRRLNRLGGNTIRKCVINMFNELFTPRLRSKICWIGSSVGKMSFQQFKGIRNLIRSSVKKELHCTLEESDKECKLRLKQGNKDYTRYKIKNSN